MTNDTLTAIIVVMKKINPLISEYMASIGRKGGATNKAKGRDYFSNMGRISAQKRWGKTNKEDNNETETLSEV